MNNESSGSNFKIGDRVHLFFKAGDGSYATYGVVKEVDGPNYLVEETEYESWVWDHKIKEGHFENVPFKPRRFSQDSATRWFRPVPKYGPNEYEPDDGPFTCRMDHESEVKKTMAERLG